MDKSFVDKISTLMSYPQSKLDVRQLRKSILDEVKKAKGSVSEDESKRFTKEVRYCSTIMIMPN